MNAHPAADGPRPSDPEQLREQIAEDRRALAATISALHSRTDVKKVVRHKAAGVEIAAADAVGRVGRTACSLPHLARSAADQAQHQAAEQAHKVPEPVRAPVGAAAALLRRRLGAEPAAGAAIVAVSVGVLVGVSVAVFAARRRWRGH